MGVKTITNNSDQTQMNQIQSHHHAFTPVHRCRFVQYSPSAIVSLAFAPSSTKRQRYLAAARANGNIELWNPRGKSWFLERTIHGSAEAPIESVVWVHQTSSAEPDSTSTHEVDSSITPSHFSPLRLFSAGLTGLITEYNLSSLLPRYETDSFGGPIWCMAVNHAQSHLAVGCEDGYVRIFKILPLETIQTHGHLEFVSTIEKQSGRVMSLAWHPSDTFLVVGSVKNTIRKISVATGRSVHRMTLDTVRGEDTIVWDLKIIAPTLPGASSPSFLIVAADSLGYITFWDWNTATMRKCVKAHGADALCLASNAAGTRVFSAGVDRKIVEITLTDISSPTFLKKSQKNNNLARNTSKQDSSLATTHSNSSKRAPVSKTSWVVSGQKRFHTHDVRALLYIEDRPFDSIVSGGVDTSLIFSSPGSSFNKMKQQRMPLFPHRPLISIAPDVRLVMARFDDHVNIWRLADINPVADSTPSTNQPSISNNMDIDTTATSQINSVPFVDDHQRLDHTGHKHLMTIKFKGKTNLVTSAISSNGAWICLSDHYTVKLYRVSFPYETSTKTDESNPTGSPIIKRAKKFHIVGGASCVLFSPDSSKLIVAGTDSIVRVVDLEMQLNGSFKIAAEFNQHAGDASKSDMYSVNQSDSVKACAGILLISICTHSKYMATADVLNRVYVYNLESLQLHSTLPVFTSLLTSMTFHPGMAQQYQETTQLPIFSPTLVLTSMANELIMYDIGSESNPGKISDWSRLNSHRLPEAFVERRESVMGVCVDPNMPMRLVVWGAYMVCFVDLSVGLEAVSHKSKNNLKRVSNAVNNQDIETTQTHQGKKNTKHASTAHGTQVTLRKGFVMDTRYQSIMYMEYAGSELVVIERPVLHVLATLPVAFYKHKYGT
ncbi:U3 small nucleolar RNA-associated protein [Batrachochytrium dendrobatidis]|nr:U3 small nucleolar RNA-associated protein [Batrachochytrium dendrobatidis]